MQQMIKVKSHSCVDHLIVSDLVCGVSYHTRAVLLHGMRCHKLDLIQLAVPHTHMVFLLYNTQLCIWQLIQACTKDIHQYYISCNSVHSPSHVHLWWCREQWGVQGCFVPYVYLVYWVSLVNDHYYKNTSIPPHDLQPKTSNKSGTNPPGIINAHSEWEMKGLLEEQRIVKWGGLLEEPSSSSQRIRGRWWAVLSTVSWSM